MNPIDKLFVKYREMSKQELLMEMGVLLYKLYNYKTVMTHYAIKYTIRLITSELSKRL
jgi:hypothetical protein